MEEERRRLAARREELREQKKVMMMMMVMMTMMVVMMTMMVVMMMMILVGAHPRPFVFCKGREFSVDENVWTESEVFCREEIFFNIRFFITNI